MDTENFELLENSLPDISFDRWDYFMRDGFAIGFLHKSLINEFLKGVKLKNNKLYFNDVRLASTFAILFTSFSRLIWLDPTSHGAMYLVADVLKHALTQKFISEDDFFTDDELLIAKLRKTKNSKINKLLDRLKTGKEFVYVSQTEAEFFGTNKPRSVDPLVSVSGKLKRVSTLVPSLKYYFEEFKEKYKYIGVRQIEK